jgi:hypothetical protein
MKLSRRALLTASLGVGQLALLERFGFLGNARADTGSGPTKLLVLYLQGGFRPYTFFVPPMSDADVARVIPPPADFDQEPVYFTPDKLIELGTGSGGFAGLRIAQTWDPADPKNRAGYTFTPSGYGWVDAKLADRTTVIHGINQGAFDHGGAYVSAMCGVPGASYRAPAFVSVIANFLNQRFADTRPLPCVAIRANGMPVAAGLPAAASPVLIQSFDGISSYFSADPAVAPWWKGHEARSPFDVPPFGADDPTRSIPVTDLERFTLQRLRKLHGHSSAGTDAIAQQMYEGYAQTSTTLARDVVKVLNATKGAEHAKPDYAAAYGPFGVTFGLANGGVDLAGAADMTLRLLKSDLCSVVYAFLDEVYYDSHSGQIGQASGTARLRAELDIISRILSEMKQTPAPGLPGKTLYDDTLVVILSEFSRTWASGKDQSSAAGWQFPDDHFNYTSVILTGGNTAPNRQIGGFDLDPAVKGQEVAILDESGTMVKRVPTAADLVATVCGAFGMKMGTDFFIPGGYGQIQGAISM